MSKQDELAHRRARLTPARRELLSKRLQSVCSEQEVQPAIAPSDWRDTAPLSYGQERIWFIQQLLPDSTLYNTPVLLRLQGTLDRDVLERALNRVVSRHAVLRSRYFSVKGSPIQKIEPKVTVELQYEDLRGLPDPSNEVQRQAVQEAWHIFDLEKGAFKRAKLFSLASNQHLLLLGLHHIVFDAWSGFILCQELASFYSAELTGTTSPLPPLRIQYPDYASWQRSQVQSEKIEGQLTYWRRQLADLPAEIEIPGEQPYSRQRDNRGAIYYSEITDSLLKDLEALSASLGATFFMLLLAAFNALLYRYTGKNDLVLGTAIAGRNQVDFETLIGTFANTLVMRTQLNGNLPFRHLLLQVRKTALEAYANQDIPFEKLVQDLKPQRDWSRTPFFRFFINTRNIPQTQLPAGDIHIQRLDFDPQIAFFDLSLEVNTQQGKILPEAGMQAGRTLRWVYATEVFSAGFIERLAADYFGLLKAIAANADCTLDELPLVASVAVGDPGLAIARPLALTADERRQILVEWNHTQVDLPRKNSVLQLFEEQVERTPDAIALISDQPFEKVTPWLHHWLSDIGGSPSLTYTALNHCANLLAHKLRKMNVLPGCLVGICLEHSLETVVAVWAVLKAGGAYVPLDPAYPAERLKFMMLDAQMPVLISRQAHIEKLGLSQQKGGIVLDSSFIEAIILDQPDSDLALESSANPPVVASRDNLAYVIYTSGSTGRPKGAGIPHGALLNYTVWMQSMLKLNSSDRLLFKTPFSFDASVWETILPLSYGAILAITRPQGQRDPRYLCDVIQSHAITVVQVVPTQLRLLLADQSFRWCTSLRCVCCGGETLTPDLVLGLQAALPDSVIINLYGPTETCIYSTSWVCPPDATVAIVPIGRPISNLLVHILDSDLKPVPAGFTGEIFIGGAGLGVGYISRPELTQQKFIANPVPETATRSEKLYRTGDLARYLPDGNIEFLGRADDQVKMRGFRIELGEIEMALCDHLAIQQAAVVLRTQSLRQDPENRMLIAYLVLQPGCSKPSSHEMRSFLKERLPDYMLPALFVFLDAMPLTSSNKIDRRALPEPDLVEGGCIPEFQLPRDDIERRLVQIWLKILRHSKVGIGDNFFDLGGHSLLAMQLVAYISDEFRIDLPVRTVFDAPTLVEMADLIRIFLRQSGADEVSDMIEPAIPREAGEL